MCLMSFNFYMYFIANRFFFYFTKRTELISIHRSNGFGTFLSHAFDLDMYKANGLRIFLFQMRLTLT